MFEAELSTFALVADGAGSRSRFQGGSLGCGVLYF